MLYYGYIFNIPNYTTRLYIVYQYYICNDLKHKFRAILDYI